MNIEHHQSIVFFDGMCNLCCSLINFIIRRDRERRFRFVPLQSELGKSLQGKYCFPDEHLDAITLVDDGATYFKSTAVFKILHRLGGVWRILSLLIVLPAGFRDAAYAVIAKNRYRVFQENIARACSTGSIPTTIPARQERKPIIIRA